MHVSFPKGYVVTVINYKNKSWQKFKPIDNIEIFEMLSFLERIGCVCVCVCMRVRECV